MQNLLRYAAGVPDASGVYRDGLFPDRRGSDASGAAGTPNAALFTVVP